MLYLLINVIIYNINYFIYKKCIIIYLNKKFINIFNSKLNKIKLLLEILI